MANVGREQRAGYIFPGFRVFIPEIAELGEDGGPGFTADGLIDQRGDAMYASVRSILPAEENAGQLLSDTVYGGPLNATGLESAYDKELGGIGLQIEDYTDFKANGIIAPVKERTAGLTFQSDVTSVDPTLQPALAPQNRRYMADFIIDSLSDIASLYVKKLNTPIRRRSLLAQYNGFLEGLQSPNQPEASRIRDYAVKDVTSPDLLNQGFLVAEVAVQTYESILYVVNRITVGATVNVEELG